MAWLLANWQGLLLVVSLLLNGVVVLLRLLKMDSAADSVKAVEDVVDQLDGQKKA